jgi:type II secretory pathway pseudopilin PulG
MEIAALATWITAAAGGLYLLSIWLIEYDKQFQAAAATRLSPVVLACHVLFAGGGLVVWAGYLILGSDTLGWIAVVAVLLAATLGSALAVRWFGVYRETRALRLAAAAELATEQLASSGSWSGNAWQQQGGPAPTSQARRTATLVRQPEIGPPERNFPLSMVIGHGLFAFTTVALVLLTAFGVGGS